MKKIVLIILIALSFYSKAQTWVYHPFPDSNAVWNIQLSFYCWLSPYGMGGRDYSITFSNDTVIGSQTYHKLITPFDPPITSTCGGGSPHSNVYRGAIRQDTSVRKVFIVPPADNTEQLLYDFTMQVGDTVKGYISWCRSVVQSIDSIVVGSSYRKMWFLGNYTSSIYLIEGVGLTYGLIQQYYCGTDDPYYSITCFKQNGQILYNPYPYTTTNCELITSINSIEKKSVQINVYPNPSNGSFTIDFDQGYIKKIELIDLLGNTILQQEITNESTFEIENLQSGTCFLKVIDKNSRISTKKVVIIN